METMNLTPIARVKWIDALTGEYGYWTGPVFDGFFELRHARQWAAYADAEELGDVVNIVELHYV